MKDPRRVATGRIGAYRLHGLYDSRALTANARAGWLKRFRKEALEADPELEVALLSEDEKVRQDAWNQLERRAAYLRTSHMRLLAYNREKARKEKAAVASTSTAAKEAPGGSSTDLPEAV